MFRHLHRDAGSPACNRESRFANCFKTSSKREFVYSLLVGDEQGAALLEFAIALPLLVVFVVGIFDFSGAFDQKQKVEQAAQEGAVVAGAQPTSDIASPTAPNSLQPVVTAVFNSLVGSGVLPTGTCTLPAVASGPVGLAWTYTISCPDSLVIVINRGWACPAPCAAGPPVAVGTVVTVTYPYHWRFNSVIQLLFPGTSGYASPTITESATVHNQT
jgi:Flp pilus assembly protein TadG